MKRVVRLLLWLCVLGIPRPGDAQRPSLIGMWVIGGSSPEVEDRMVGHGLRGRGWEGLMRDEIYPFVQWCRRSQIVPRVELHNPGGMLGHKIEKMNFLQYEHARRAGLDWLHKDFVKTFRPLTREGVEVIAYVGGPHNSKEWRAEFAAEDPPDLHARISRALAPYLAAGCAIGLDNAVTQPEEGTTHLVALDLEARGVKVYVEATADNEHRHWWRFPQIILDSLYARRHGTNQHPGAKGRFPKRNSEGFYEAEIVRFLVNRDERGQLVKLRQRSGAIAADGHTPMLVSPIIRRVRRQGWSARSLLETRP